MTGSTGAGFHGAGELRCDARHDHDRDALRAEIFQFFVAAVGLERIAARKTDNLMSGVRGLRQPSVDFALTDPRLALALADEHQLGVAARTIQDLSLIHI